MHLRVNIINLSFPCQQGSKKDEDYKLIIISGELLCGEKETNLTQIEELLLAMNSLTESCIL